MLGEFHRKNLYLDNFAVFSKAYLHNTAVSGT